MPSRRPTAHGRRIDGASKSRSTSTSLARGRGVATSLYHRLHDVLGKQGYLVAYAAITIPNPVSIGLHEALGYERIGTFRRAAR